MRGRGEDEETEGSKRKNAMAAKVPFFGMFRYAGRTDFALIAVGTAAAMVNGMSEPLMTVVFSAVIETFGSSDDSTILHRVSKVRTSTYARQTNINGEVVFSPEFFF
jgi:ATP-binding cassette subfamily B (MDR/TAP) protein 1